MKIDTYEALAELPIDAVIRDADEMIARKRHNPFSSFGCEWQVMGADSGEDGYLILRADEYFTLPVEVLLPR